MAKTYGGRCKTIGSVGEGGQAHVFTVEDANGVHQERFVLKRLKNIKRMDLFEREVNALRAVDHPNILRVVDFALNADPSFYVAEYCEGGSLDKRAEEFKGNIRGAAEVLTPIIAALRAAHAEGVFHRDVKPPNILFRKDGTPVLGDFGICHMEGDERVTLSDEAMGSKDYIAPEMESGRQGPVTGAVDVYALGKVMYWMVSGGRIFAREDHRAGNLYLPSILSAQRWDHVHSLLDRVLTEDPRPRLHIGDLTTWLEGIRDLIEGNFMPLRPSLGLKCRFCGIGTYRKIVGPDAGRLSRLGLQSASIDIRAFRCSRCGHIEWFDFQAIDDEKWWDR